MTCRSTGTPSAAATPGTVSVAGPVSVPIGAPVASARGPGHGLLGGGRLGLLRVLGMLWMLWMRGMLVVEVLVLRVGNVVLLLLLMQMLLRVMGLLLTLHCVLGKVTVGTQGMGGRRVCGRQGQVRGRRGTRGQRRDGQVVDASARHRREVG